MKHSIILLASRLFHLLIIILIHHLFPLNNTFSRTLRILNLSLSFNNKQLRNARNIIKLLNLIKIIQYSFLLCFFHFKLILNFIWALIIYCCYQFLCFYFFSHIFFLLLLYFHGFFFNSILIFLFFLKHSLILLLFPFLTFLVAFIFNF